MVAPVDINILNDILHDLYFMQIEKVYGEHGMQVFKDVLLQIPRVYEMIPLEKQTKRITIYKFLTEDDSDGDAPHQTSNLKNLTDLSQEVEDGFSIQILRDGYFVRSESPEDLLQLSKDAIVYSYLNGTEEFYFAGKRYPKKKLGPFLSDFAVPTFHRFEDALNDYQQRIAAKSSCPMLVKIWDSEDRIFFVNGPEDFMRDSLAHYLKCTIGREDEEVWPEHNVDGSHPVDIRVSWRNKRIALIEIKWLGDTRKYAGRGHRDSRANEGARQLVDYLEGNTFYGPTHIAYGYLVVFDGRRRGLKEDTQTVTQADGLYYKNKAINFDPKFHEIRKDFEEPIRIFMEPICRL